MNILVCVKQTPDLGMVKLGSGGRNIDRSGPTVINPFDLYAMEAAARLKDEDSSVKISALCMGPRSAEPVLKDCLALGADQAWLVSGDEFAGADVRATAHILKTAIRKLEKEEGVFDAVFCGSKSTDGGTAMLPHYLGELLGRSASFFALECRLIKEKGRSMMEILKENDAGNEVYRLSLPCVVSFTKSAERTRYPLAGRIIQASRVKVPVLGAEDLFPEGEFPSPVLRIESITCTELKKSSVIVREEDLEEGTKKLVSMLYKAHVL